MSADILLNYFNRISDASDAIPRFRRFILDLAVRGKLVEQDPQDEPAVELLNRIQKEKKKLENIKKSKKEKPFNAGSNNQPPFSLPFIWQWSQLADIGIINPRNVADDGLSASFVSMPMIFAEYGLPNQHEVRPWGEIKKGYTHFAEGDVGLAKITPCFENGKSTIFRDLTGGIGAGTTELHIVRPIFVVAEYLLIFLKSPHFIKTGTSKMTGTAGQKRVATEYFTCSPFPLPPLAEQHRIVAKVDELIELCDQLQAAKKERETKRDRLVASSLNRIITTKADEAKDAVRFHFGQLPRLTTRPEHIKQLRQTILTLAVRGRLVPQDPNDEPAVELLKRIQAEKLRLVKKGEIKKEIPPISAETKDLTFPLKSGWWPAKISQVLVELQTGPFGSSLHQSDYEKDGIPVVNPASIRNERLIPVDGMAVGKATLDRLATFKLRKNDIVLARRGEMGRCAAVTEKEAGWLCGTGSLILRLPECVAPRFLVLLLGSPFVREYLGGSAVGATMQNLNQSILYNLTFGLPPLAEQSRIVAKVDELMALCDKLETQLTTTETDSRLLLETVLSKALDTRQIEPA